MATNHLEFKTGGPENIGADSGTIAIGVDAANATSVLAVGDTIELCDIVKGTIILSVDEVVLTAPTAAATTQVASVTSAHDFKGAAVVGVGGAIDTCLMGETGTTATNAKYFPVADTLRVTIAANPLTGAALVYLVNYKTVNLKAKP